MRIPTRRLPFQQNPSTMPSLPEVLCPICEAPLTRLAGSFHCPQRHCFDVAKEGYLSLLHGTDKGMVRGDDADMIRARLRAHQLPPYLGLAQALAGLCAPLAPGASVLDLGCGDGFFLRQFCLDTPVSLEAVGLDVSREAVARAAKLHREAFYLRADAVLRKLPFPSGHFDCLLSVFAPRPEAEIHRVLKPGGLWAVVTAAPEHLGELRAHLPLAAIGTEKLSEAISSGFALRRQESFRQSQELGREDLAAVIGMSPSVHRLRRERGPGWADSLPESLRLTFSFELSLLTPV